LKFKFLRHIGYSTISPQMIFVPMLLLKKLNIRLYNFNNFYFPYAIKFSSTFPFFLNIVFTMNVYFTRRGYRGMFAIKV